MKKIISIGLAIIFSFSLAFGENKLSAEGTSDEVENAGMIVDDGSLYGSNEGVESENDSIQITPQNEKKMNIATSVESGDKVLSPILSRAPDPGNRWLSVPYKRQENGWYCGPAAVQMVLAYKGKNVSQSVLAGKLGTNSSTGTPAGASVANTINYYIGNKYSWSWHSWSDVNGLRSKIYAGTSVGDPAVVNTGEYSYDWYLAGHGNYARVFHYGTTAGYSMSADTVRYLDPGAGIFTGFVASRDYLVWKLSYAMGGQGLAW